MSNAKEKGLRVDQIFKYFKSEGAGDDDDITPDDFEAAMKKLGWSISAGELAALIDHFDEDKNGTVSMEEFLHYCLHIPTLAWKAERLRHEREAAARAPKPPVDARLAPEDDEGDDAPEDGASLEAPAAPLLDADGAPAPGSPALVGSASAPEIAKKPPSSPKRSRLSPDQIYAGQKPLWKSKQFLTLKIGYEKTLKVLAVSAKDADDRVFAPLFVDAARVLEAKRDHFDGLVAAELEARAKKQGGASPGKPEKQAAGDEVISQELANFVIRRVGTAADDASTLVLAMLSSDGELKASDVVYRKNPGVHALQVAPATSRRPSMEDFNAMTAEVGEAREAAAVERAAGSAAMERLRKSLDAFTIKHAKPFCDMDNTEKLKFLLVRFSFKHMVNKVTNRLNHSKVYKAMLAEQAAKKRNYGRRPSLGDL